MVRNCIFFRYNVLKATFFLNANQINFLFVVHVVFQSYHFSKQFLSNLSKIKYLAFFIRFCFVVSLAKMVTLTTNIVDKKSAQYRKYIWYWEENISKQMEIPTLLTVFLAIPLNRLPWLGVTFHCSQIEFLLLISL